jgi:hypothetical protein
VAGAVVANGSEKRPVMLSVASFWFVSIIHECYVDVKVLLYHVYEEELVLLMCR